MAAGMPSFLYLQITCSYQAVFDETFAQLYISTESKDVQSLSLKTVKVGTQHVHDDVSTLCHHIPEVSKNAGAQPYFLVFLFSILSSFWELLKEEGMPE